MLEGTVTGLIYVVFSLLTKDNLHWLKSWTLVYILEGTVTGVIYVVFSLLTKDNSRKNKYRLFVYIYKL